MKKFMILMLCMISIFALTGCDLFGPKEEDFTGSGITITLTEDFEMQQTVMYPFYLVSLDHIFMGMRESKSSLNAYSINTLQEYADAVMTNGGHDGETTNQSDADGTTYIYAYYTATVEDIEYGYMLVCMESSTYFYSMNFGCLEKDLEDSKTQYHKWADTIIVS